jgi:hypothetical protein
MVSVFATGPKIREFRFGWGDGLLKVYELYEYERNKKVDFRKHFIHQNFIL